MIRTASLMYHCTFFWKYFCLKSTYSFVFCFFVHVSLLYALGRTCSIIKIVLKIKTAVLVIVRYCSSFVLLFYLILYIKNGHKSSDFEYRLTSKLICIRSLWMIKATGVVSNWAYYLTFLWNLMTLPEMLFYHVFHYFINFFGPVDLWVSVIISECILINYFQVVYSDIVSKIGGQVWYGSLLPPCFLSIPFLLFSFPLSASPIKSTKCYTARAKICSMYLVSPSCMQLFIPSR